jgi:hypothetical protein
MVKSSPKNKSYFKVYRYIELRDAARLATKIRTGRKYYTSEKRHKRWIKNGK